MQTSLQLTLTNHQLTNRESKTKTIYIAKKQIYV